MDYPDRQVDDFRSAVSCLQTRLDVQPERIGLWGVSIGGSVAVHAAVLDRRVKAVVVQSPSVWNGWRYLERLLGREGVHAMRDQRDQDWQRRHETGTSLPEPRSRQRPAGARPVVHAVPHLPQREDARLHRAPAHLRRLAPTPLIMIANGHDDPYHVLEEAQSAFAKAGEPKRLEILPYDVLGLYTGPGLEEAMELAVGRFDRYLRQTRLPSATPAPTADTVAAMRQ
ncbi:alpha/beta hydrolase [Nonomuraea typhae]|uniref:Alpha/beta hydrolase n=1 Tax=Nonomuraea typhae TaxID=2603600 RepID=A0ABW7Z3F4_9ACTN